MFWIDIYWERENKGEKKEREILAGLEGVDCTRLAVWMACKPEDSLKTSLVLKSVKFIWHINVILPEHFKGRKQVHIKVQAKAFHNTIYVTSRRVTIESSLQVILTYHHPVITNSTINYHLISTSQPFK
jgi:hypothetical protein